MPDSTHPLLLFDGVCNLCNSAVQAVIRRDPEGRVRLASLQSDAAAHALAEIGVDAADLPDSMVLIENGTVRTRSAAAIRLSRILGFPWSLFAITWIIPRPIRDWVYGVIARNRYRWFGKRESCMTPDPALRARFLDAGDVAADADR